MPSLVWAILFSLCSVAAQQGEWQAGTVPTKLIGAAVGVVGGCVALLFFLVIVCFMRIRDKHKARLQRAIESFPVAIFPTGETAGFDSTECQICLEEFGHGETVRVLPTCRHIFHMGCVDPWLGSRGMRCPICRHDYSNGELNRMP